MKKNTSYPAIALLVSVFILITAFAWLIAGHNNYIEEQREVGKEIIEEFLKYNVLQYYLYVLSDYEARKAFFNAVYDVFANSIGENGYLNISELNEGILGWSDGCENLTNYTIIDNFLVVYPCIRPIPLSDFQNELNETFIESIVNNFKPEENLENITSYYGVDISQTGKGYFIGDNYFNLYQEVNYSYISNTYNRQLEIGVNYSIIPSIVIYNQLVSGQYWQYYYNYIKLLKGFFGQSGNPVLTYGGVDNAFNELGIEYSRSIGNYTLLFNGSSGKTYLTEFENFLRIYMLNREANVSYFEAIQEFPMPCWSFGQYEFSSGNVSYVDKDGCRIATLNNVPHEYNYFIEECLFNTSYYTDGDIGEMNSTYAELIFYNFSFTEPEIITIPGMQTYFGIDEGGPKNIEETYSDYLWPAGGKYNVLTLVKIGDFVPIRCVLGESTFDKYFSNEIECFEAYKMLLEMIRAESGDYIEITKPCVCTDEKCTEYVLEWIIRIRNVSEATDISNLSLAIYWPYYQMEDLKSLISS